MIIEPVPTSPRSPRRRALGRLGLLTPVLLLAVVIAAGVLGRAAEPPSAGPPGESSPADLSPGGPPEPRTGATPIPGSGVLALGDGPAWPTVAADLEVRTVDEVLALGATTDLVVAVSGYLGFPSPSSCAARPEDAFGPLCERRGILAARPWVTHGAGVFAQLGVHLHPRFPVGVPLPSAITRAVAPAGGDPVPVVLVGRRVADGGSCPGAGRTCDQSFLVDRVVWVDGSDSPTRLVVDSGIDTSPAEWVLAHAADAQMAAIGWSGTLLVTALLRPDTVARVDADADRALQMGPPPAGLVWYVRGLETEYDPTRYPLGQSPPRLSWALLDDVTGQVIARGWDG